MRRLKKSLILWGLGLALAPFALAQTPPAPPPDVTGNFGAGFALTGGNTDTTNFNLSYELVRDPKTRNVMKFNGLYLRGDQDDERVIDRLRIGFRDEYSLSERTFLFGQFDYLRDPFKEISYLLNPLGGIGYKLIQTDRLLLSLDGGAGTVFEKNPGFDLDSSGSLNAGQNLVFKLSEATAITQVLAGLWKMDDFEDALYHFALGLTTSIAGRAELKVEFIDDFKNVTRLPTIKKNDTAFVTTFLYKF